MLETWSSQEALPHRGFSTVSGPVPTAALEAAPWEPRARLPGPHALTAGKPTPETSGLHPELPSAQEEGAEELGASGSGLQSMSPVFYTVAPLAQCPKPAGVRQVKNFITSRKEHLAWNTRSPCLSCP